jgi:hypothetical protein
MTIEGLPVLDLALFAIGLNVVMTFVGDNLRA